MANYVPISSELHSDKNWVRTTSIAYAKSDTVAPLYVNELSVALHSMPIAFIKQQEKYNLVVVMGLQPGHNVFVSNDNKWLSEYLPVTYRCSPFELFSVQGREDEQVLCIDTSCIVDKGFGEPFFQEAGKITTSIADAFEFVKTLNIARQQTHRICTAIADSDLLEPWPMILDDGANQHEVNGLYRVNETAMNDLPAEKFLELRTIGALPVMYAQLFSMQKIGGLAKLVKLSEPNRNTIASETFDFGGLN